MQKILLIFLFFGVFRVSAQKIEGTVKDTEGNVLSFASIIVAGTPMGTTTNDNGRFSISLPPGNYTIECRYVGYASQEKKITLGSSNQIINFILPVQELKLKEVVVRPGAEDPAYEIIRQAIKKRPFYNSQVKAFEAKVYLKGLIKLRNLPGRIFGQKIPEEDKSEMGLDSSGQGIVYLSESVEKVSAQEPDKFKLEVLSSRLSGSNSFGFDFPVFISFYENNVDVFDGGINSRGFISPIADNALNFYNYKFLGSFFEDGNEVNVIKVMPKRNYEPLFSGIINITENDWRIYSCNLTLTKESQLEILDTITVSQMHIPVENDVWRIKNQSLHVSLDKMGLKAVGNFVSVYSDYNLHPDFAKGYFNRVVIKYDTAVSKKPHSYWDSIRPVPLEPEEIKDYRTKDSAFAVRKDYVVTNIDSLRKKQGPVKVVQLFWTGVNRTLYGKTKNYQIHFDPLIMTLQYNTVEGVAINPSLVLSKRLPEINSKISFIADARYGFTNRHFNPWGGLVFNSNDNFDPEKKYNHQSFFIAGGKRVSQFFKEIDLTGLANSVATLLYGQNDMKIYENYFAKAGYSKQWESGVKFLIEGEYEDRIPINNTTDFIFTRKYQHVLKPNYPVEIMSSQFQRHQAVVMHTYVSITPGQRYIQFPKYKMPMGSNYPTFTLDYTKGFKSILGSDVNYDKWSLNIIGDLGLKLAGALKYNATLGGFLNAKSTFAQDYKHFYTSFSHISGQFVKSFQNLTYYQFSNTSSFYSELHLEHHANGLLTNKIPLLKKWNWNLVEGTNAVFINPKTDYGEFFVGLENILKIFRIDAVVGLQNGYKPVYTYRIGFGGILGNTLNIVRFKRVEKIVNVW
ncbi:MAG TPA: DUF5686 and carboxypeptidase regulatory-like domain-containing protein [Hanamia sp.]